MLVENIVPAPQAYSAGGVVVPSASAGDFNTAGGASTSEGRPDAKTSGANLRSGGPGGTGTVRLGSGLVGKGHTLSSIHMSFRYVTGYGCSPVPCEKAPVVKLLVLDLATSKVLATACESLTCTPAL